MALSEYTKSRIPKKAASLIERAIDDVQGGVDLDPKKADKIRSAIVEAVTNTVDLSKNANTITYNELAAGLNDFYVKDSVVAEHLHGIAQSIALLTGQKDGAYYEPRALKPRV